MKKTICSILISMLVLVMGSVTAFALEIKSPDAKLDVIDDQLKVKVTVINAENTNSKNEAYELVETDDYSDKIILEYDRELNNNIKEELDKNGSVEIIFDVDGIKSGDLLVICYRKDDGTLEEVTAVVDDGKITCTFTDLPTHVFVVKYGKSAVTPNYSEKNTTVIQMTETENSGTKTASKTSPKTAEAIPIAAVAAVIAFAGAVICIKKIAEKL